ncbi:MAG: hypothetical protein GTO63_23670, partial [Anaerolineae bacterium]|nr:hypothetical protein [Anaerolineae bacterium]NIN97725.1 hypothetical protein [Anaerolineae bacterium]NIQ80706.1 hypothetical protein [Anaerolineae bacterium]
RQVHLSRADIVPDDLISVSEFSEQQIAFANQYYGMHGERWIGNLLLGDTEMATGEAESGAEY